MTEQVEVIQQPVAANGKMELDAPLPGRLNGAGTVDFEADLPGEPEPASGADLDNAEQAEAPAAGPTNVLPSKLYFLRVAKPDLSEQEIRIQHLKAECAAYKDACDKALAAAKMSNEHKFQCKEDYDNALAQFRVSKAERDTLAGRLQPLRDTNRQLSNHRSEMNDMKRELPASSLAELDGMIADAEFRHDHETMDKRSENALIIEIKRLNKARAHVARFEQEYSQVEASRDEMATFKASKGELEKQLTIVRDECNVAKSQMDEKWDVLSEAKTHQEAVSKEFQRLREAKDAKWAELNEERAQLKAAQDKYYDNRRFSQRVRAAIAEGHGEEALELCRELNETLIGELVTDAAAYEEYVACWELQRKYAVSQAAMSLDAPESKGKGGGKAASKANQENSGLSANTDAIIAAIMAEIDGHAPPAPPLAAAVRRAPLTNGAAVVEMSARGRKVPAPAPAPANDAPPEPVAVKPKPAPKPKAAKAAPAPEPVAELDDTFVPPAREAPAAAKLTPAQLKEALRREQAEKAAEAEARKKKLEERKAQKKEKAQELAKQREAEEVQAKAIEQARIQREAEMQRAAAQKKKDAAARRAADGAAAKPGKGRGSAKGGQAVSAARPRPVKSTPMLRMQRFAKDNGPLLAVGGIVVLLAALIVLMLQMG